MKSSRRRLLLAAGLGALSIRRASGQVPPAKIGLLLARPLPESFYAPPILTRLAELGYRDGKTLQVEHRSADGVADRFPSLARELIDTRCNVIFAVGPELAVRALQAAGSSPPIVFVAVDYDPVEKNIVTDLRRPDRNTTGVYVPQSQLAAKRLEVMREVLAGARRYLVLVDVFSRDQLPAVREVAQATVVEFTRHPYDLQGAFESGRKAQVQAVIFLASPVIAQRAAELSDLLLRFRLPAAGWAVNMESSGFLLGYSDLAARTSRRAADIGVRILRGARPADIPVEQAHEFEFAVNLSVARALGVTIPASVMARATRIVH